MNEHWYESFAAGYTLAEAINETEEVWRKMKVAYEVWKEAKKKQLVTEILVATGKSPFVSEATYFRVARLVEMFANSLEYANRTLIK